MPLIADLIDAAAYKESQMKRHVIFASVTIVIFALIAMISITKRSHSQDRSNIYLGGVGWSLKQDIMVKLPGEEPKLFGRREKYFAAGGLRKDIDYIINKGGEAERRSIIIYDPSRGVFAQNY